jgi:hypothetical protein
MQLAMETLIDRNAAVARVTLSLGAREFAATGSAKREPGDPYDETLGEQLALARALHALSVMVDADAQLRVPRVK